MIKTYEVYIHTNKVGSECTEIVTVDMDEYTDPVNGTVDDQALEEDLKEIAFNMMDWGYKEVK